MDEAPDRSDQLLRRVFYTIIRGYSGALYQDEPVFLKHFTFAEQGKLEEAYKEAFDKAKSQGLDTEKQCYEFLVKENIWSKEEEEELKRQQEFLEGLHVTRKNVAIPHQIELLTIDIERAEKVVAEILEKKSSLLPETCESYAQKKSNDLVIYYSYYTNEKCSKRAFSWEEYCSLTKEELHQLFVIYNEAIMDLNIDNIKYLAISNFFSLYANVLGSKNMHTFLDKPMPDHTFYQLHLLNYAKILTSIVENVQNIPDNCKDDPDKLIDYASSAAKGDKMKDKSRESDGYSVVGARRKEMDSMGVSDVTKVDIHKLAAAKGGSLTMEDFAKLT